MLDHTGIVVTDPYVGMHTDNGDYCIACIQGVKFGDPALTGAEIDLMFACAGATER